MTLQQEETLLSQEYLFTTKQYISFLLRQKTNPVLCEALNNYVSLAESQEVLFNKKSRLTNNGVPIEFAFVWPDGDLRFTADMLPAGNPVARFWASYNRLPEPQTHYQSLRQILPTYEKTILEEEHKFRYGAWIGYREKSPAPKLYIEITPCPHILPAQILSSLKEHLPSKKIVPVMAGFSFNGDYEYYFRISHLYARNLSTLFKLSGIPDQSKSVQQLLETLIRRYIKAEIPTTDLGISIACSIKGDIQALTIYSYAQSLLGLDPQIKKAVLELGKEYNWDMDPYLELTAGLEKIKEFDINTWHGMVGIVASKDGKILFNTGLSPQYFA
jgi:hypothetical protein